MTSATTTPPSTSPESTSVSTTEPTTSATTTQQSATPESTTDPCSAWCSVGCSAWCSNMTPARTTPPSTTPEWTTASTSEPMTSSITTLHSTTPESATAWCLACCCDTTSATPMSTESTTATSSPTSTESTTATSAPTSTESTTATSSPTTWPTTTGTTSPPSSTPTESSTVLPTWTTTTVTTSPPSSTPTESSTVSTTWPTTTGTTSPPSSTPTESSTVSTTWLSTTGTTSPPSSTPTESSTVSSTWPTTTGTTSPPSSTPTESSTVSTTWPTTTGTTSPPSSTPTESSTVSTTWPTTTGTTSPPSSTPTESSMVSTTWPTTTGAPSPPSSTPTESSTVSPTWPTTTSTTSPPSSTPTESSTVSTTWPTTTGTTSPPSSTPTESSTVSTTWPTTTDTTSPPSSNPTETSAASTAFPITTVSTTSTTATSTPTQTEGATTCGGSGCAPTTSSETTSTQASTEPPTTTPVPSEPPTTTRVQTERTTSPVPPTSTETTTTPIVTSTSTTTAVTTTPTTTPTTTVTTTSTTTRTTTVVRCTSTTCRNGGTCVPSGNSYYCICPCGWTGPNCDIADKLLPFGPEYDSVVQFTGTDDGYSPTIYFTQDFLFGCTYHRQFWINVNGFVSLDQPIVDWYPVYFPLYGRRMIAPFWADIDLTGTTGKVYYRQHFYTSDMSSPNLQDQEVVIAATHLMQNTGQVIGFTPTIVVKITWHDVSPYPGYWYSNEKACFQLLLITDHRTGQSYAVYLYRNIAWSWYRRSVQGFQESYSFYNNMYTSLSTWSYDLPYIGSNTVTPGIWVHRVSTRACEGSRTSYDYMCRNWVSWQYNLAWYNWFPPCPCQYWQALFDPRFYVDGQGCAVSTFTNPWSTVAQRCCYQRNPWYWWGWGWNWWWGWWWWLPYDTLMTSYTYDSGSAVMYHPLYYPWAYSQYDDMPKRWCCLYSDNCYLYYSVRPASNCWGYWTPFFAFMWGDPHIQTLDNFQYTFNGLGEYWLIMSSTQLAQARTVQAWDNNKQPTVSATVFGAIAAAEYTNGTDSPKTSRLHVEMPEDRTSAMTILVDDINDMGSWFSRAGNFDPPQMFSGLQLSRSNDTLVATFASGFSVMITLRGYQLDVSTFVPPQFKNNTDMRGLFGNFNGNPSDDLISSTGVQLDASATEEDIFTTFGESWRLTSAADTLFWYNLSAGHDFLYYSSPGSYAPLFNLTDIPDDSSVDFCTVDGELNRACVYDFRATGSTFASNVSRNVDVYFQSVHESVSNNLPYINAPLKKQWTVLSAGTINLTITDVDTEDTLTMNSVNPLPVGATFSNVPGTNIWQFTWTPASMEPVQLVFNGSDSRGAAANRVSVQVILCNCSGDHGTCVWDVPQPQYNSTAAFQIVTCDCRQPLYNGTYCEGDFDSCWLNPCGGENGTCVDLPPAEILLQNRSRLVGYRCTSCPSGFELSDDASKCTDIDECASSLLNNCSSSAGNCTNNDGSYSCSCYAGYANEYNMFSCEDVDECALGLAGCQHECTNTPGNFSCSCYPGYEQVNVTSCVPSGSVPQNSTCDHFTFENGTCGCFSGYFWSDSSEQCEDVNECSTTDNRCSPTSACVNDAGSYHCECGLGFRLLTNRRTCAACNSGYWGPDCSYRCRCATEMCEVVFGCTSCDRGWTGPNCDVDVDECAATPAVCNGTARCVNTNGTYGCVCGSWYQLSDRENACVLLDACVYNANGSHFNESRCVGNGICVNGTDASRPGEYLCICPSGYTGQYCEIAIDPCSPSMCANNATCVRNSEAFNCECTPWFYGTYCSNMNDACYFFANGTKMDTPRCLNNGQCMNGSDPSAPGAFACECPLGFTGSMCENVWDACLTYANGTTLPEPPCLNNGTCVNGTDPNLPGNFSCVCRPGFTGQFCETNIDECSIDPCLNNGTCIDRINNYTCTCEPGYTGHSCETDIAECGSHPCQNSGTCVDGQNSFSCLCVSGFTGVNCQTNIDDCPVNITCQNGGTCIDGVNSYTCRCVAGYTGTTCETDINECASTPCLNGGSCTHGISRYSCACLTGYTGTNCQTPTVKAVSWDSRCRNVKFRRKHPKQCGWVRTEKRRPRCYCCKRCGRCASCCSVSPFGNCCRGCSSCHCCGRC